METTFTISESKCIACNNEVLNALGKIQGVFGAELLRSKGQITVSHTDEVNASAIIASLETLGFEATKAEVEIDAPSEWGCAL